MLELNITNEQKVKITVHPATEAGVPVILDGPISVTVSAGDGTVEMIDDLSFWLISSDAPGDTSYVVSGDADLGGGVETISDLVLVHIAGAKAKSLGLTAEEPVLKG